MRKGERERVRKEEGGGGGKEEGRRREGEGKEVGEGKKVDEKRERRRCITHVCSHVTTCHLTSLLPSDWLESRSLQLPSSFSSSWYFCVTARKLL